MARIRSARPSWLVAVVVTVSAWCLAPVAAASAAPGLPVFTSTPPAFLDESDGATFPLNWAAQAPGDAGPLSMATEKSTDGGATWVQTGGCGTSSGTGIGCGVLVTVHLADNGTLWRARVHNSAGNAVSPTTRVNVCSGLLPCTIVVTPGSATIAEGNAGTTTLEVPVNLSHPSTQAISVQWSTVFDPAWGAVAARPGGDYDASSGTVSFAPGEASKTVPVTIHGDTVTELDELVAVSFRSPTNAVMGGFWGLGFGSIADDDKPTVQPGGATVAEGGSGTVALDVPVTLSHASTLTVTVEWSTVFDPAWGVGAAQPGTDYDAASGTVTFAPGQTAKTVRITVHGDTTIEPDELLAVSFRNPTNAAMGGFWGLGFGSIRNDD